MKTKPKEDYLSILSSVNVPIYNMEFNGFFKDYEKLYHVMELQAKYITAAKQNKLKICALFYNTDVTKEVIDHFLSLINTCNECIDRIAITGIPINERAIFLLKLKTSVRDFNSYQFFASTEDAVNWLNK